MARDVIMPALGMAQESGVLVRWLVPEGGTVVEGDPLMEVETDKAVVEVPATASGTLAAVAYGEGADVAVGTVLAVLLGPGEVAAMPPVGVADAPSVTGARPAPSPAVTRTTVLSPPGPSAPATTPVPTISAHGTVLASPKAKRLARERGVDLMSVRGSGPGGAVRAVDLPAAPLEPGRERDEARSFPLQISDDPVPVAWLRRTIDASGLLDFVSRVRESSRATGAEVTVADVLTRVVVTAVGHVLRSANEASATGSRADRLGDVDLSVHGVDGAGVFSALRPDRLGSIRAIAAARVAAPGGREVADDRAPAAAVVVSDRSADAFERSPVAMTTGVELRVTLGPIAEAVTVREGTPTVVRRATVQVDYRESALTETEATTLMTRVCGLLEDPFALAVHG